LGPTQLPPRSSRSSFQLFAGLRNRALSLRLANALVRPVHYFFIAAIAVALVLVLYLGLPVFRHVAPQIYLAMLVIVVGSAFMGYWAATPLLEERHTIGRAAAQGNPGLALAVIATSHPDFQAAAIVVAYILLRMVATIPFNYWVKRTDHPVRSRVHTGRQRPPRPESCSGGTAPSPTKPEGSPFAR
jgi:hypothetical protein